MVVFLGTVRDHHAGRAVEKLTYSAYRRMAAEALAPDRGRTRSRAPDLRAAIVHRLGEVPVGEASVVIAIGSPHRAAAYEASRTALERLKAEIPIWKREHYADGRGGLAGGGAVGGASSGLIYSKISDKAISKPGKRGLFRTSPRSVDNSTARR